MTTDSLKANKGWDLDLKYGEKGQDQIQNVLVNSKIEVKHAQRPRTRTPKFRFETTKKRRRKGGKRPPRKGGWVQFFFFEQTACLMIQETCLQKQNNI